MKKYLIILTVLTFNLVRASMILSSSILGATEPYNIKPYKEKSKDELYQLVAEHKISPYQDTRDYEEMMESPFQYDEAWIDVTLPLK